MKTTKTIILLLISFTFLFSCDVSKTEKKLDINEQELIKLVKEYKLFQETGEKTVRKLPFKLTNTKPQTTHKHCCPDEEFVIKTVFKGTKSTTTSGYVLNNLVFQLEHKGSKNKKYLDKIKYISRIKDSIVQIRIDLVDFKENLPATVTMNNNRSEKIILKKGDVLDMQVYYNDEEFGKYDKCEFFCDEYKETKKILSIFENKGWNKQNFSKKKEEIKKDSDFKALKKYKVIKEMSNKDIFEMIIFSEDWLEVKDCSSRII
jgi:hypothetical protein